MSLLSPAIDVDTHFIYHIVIFSTVVSKPRTKYMLTDRVELIIMTCNTNILEILASIEINKFESIKKIKTIKR